MRHLHDVHEVPCTECRRRKKKCSHGQPCQNCARRYPPVDCSYSSLSENLFRTIYGIADYNRAKPSSLPRQIGCGTLDLLPILSVEPTAKNAELFYIYNTILLPRLWSIDGTGEAPDDIQHVWIPFTTFSPTILHSNLFRASIWKESMQRSSLKKIGSHAECINTESTDTIFLKLRSISILNSRLRSAVTSMSVDDESISAAAYFFFNEWNWSDRYSIEGIEPHLKGLRGMVKLRGGLHALGCEGIVARLVMLCYYQHGAVFDCEPFVAHMDCPRDNLIRYTAINSKFDSPLFIPDGCFSEKINCGLHLITKQFLDDITLVINKIRCHRFDEEVECEDIMLVALCVEDRLKSLPSATEINHPTSNDYLYETCRLAALIYCKAIINYIPFSQVCPLEDLEVLVATMNQVPLECWKQFPGVWLFALLAINPSARKEREGVILRSFLKICSFSIAAWEWPLYVNIMESFLCVQRWTWELEKT